MFLPLTTVQYDLVLGVADTNDSVSVSLYFYNDGIPETQAKKIANIFGRVISRIVQAPKDTVREVLSDCSS